jgi:DNA modification methylase
MRLPTLYNGNCYDILDSFEPNSIDAIITDPPYTDGKGKDALAGHKIQTLIDIPLFMEKANRVLKKDSFLAFTIQSPYDLEWRMAAAKYFDFRIDLVWAKKKGGMGGNLQMKRSHENIYIFSKGQINYFKTKGNYSDVSQALVENNLMDIQPSDIQSYNNFTDEEWCFIRLSKYRDISNLVLLSPMVFIADS